MSKKFIILNHENLNVAIANLKNYANKKLKQGKQEPFYISINPILEKRTTKQLGYYWGALIPVLKEWMNEQGNDYTDEEASNEMKRMFFYKTATVNGEKRKVLRSIANKSDTDIADMKEFIDKIIKWCHEWQIDIPICDNDYNF